MSNQTKVAIGNVKIFSRPQPLDKSISILIIAFILTFINMFY